MHLRLEELQRVVKKTIKEEKSYGAVREELFRVLGPSVMVSTNCAKVAEAANEQLDLLEATGRSPRRNQFKFSVILEAASCPSAEVRKIAARLLPERIVARLIVDPSSKVRCAAARRLPYEVVKEGLRRYPGDDQLRTIARDRKITEAGIPTPKVVEEPFDMYGDVPVGRGPQVEKDVQDTWYDRLAYKLCKEYGSNLERQWEEILATRVVASHYATSGIKLDRDKLLNAIYKCLEARDEAVLEEGSLRSIAARLRSESHLDESAMPVIETKTDEIGELLESSLSSSQYVERAEKVFCVKKSSVPAGIKKYRIGEGVSGETMIPVKGKAPNGIDARSERALDAYVEHWNKQQSIRGEPYRLSWSPNPSGVDLVGFHLELK